MPRVLIAFIVLIALAIVALAVAPRFVDPARSREVLMALLQRATGRDVEINGPITLSLLPTPQLQANDIRLANPPGTIEPDMLRIRTVEVSLAIAPLLSGRLVLRDATLSDPVLDLERRADGGTSWSGRAAAPSSAGPSSANSGDARVEPAVAVVALRIANGTLVYHAPDRNERIEGIDLTFDAPDPGDTVKASGSLSVRRVALRLELELGRLAALRAGGSAPFNLTLTEPRTASRADVAGDLVAPPDGGAAVKGRITLAGGDLASLLASVGLPGPPLLAGSFTLAGDLAADASEIRLDKLAVTLGEMRATAGLRIVPGPPPTVALTVALAQLDLDHLGASPAPAAGAAPPTRPQAPGVLLPSPASPAVAYVLPADVRGTLDLAVDALIWHHGIAREARLRASLADGAATVERAAAFLPGGSEVALSGAVAAQAGAPQFTGAVEADSDNLRQLLEWLGLATGGVPADRLRKASLSARLTASADTLGIDGFDLTLDATRFTGAATVALRRRIAFGARLAIDRLNLDAYLPDQAAGAPSVGASAATAAGMLGSFDANLDITADTVSWHGQPAVGVHLSTTLQNGDLTVREAGVADIAGTSADLSGSITGLGSDAARWQLRLDAKGPGIGRVLRTVSPDLDAGGRLSGPFSLAGSLDGKGLATTLDLTLGALGGTLNLKGDVQPDATLLPVLDLALSAAHPSALGLVRAVVPGYQPAGGDPGAFALSARLRGTPWRLTLADASLRLGPLPLDGELTLERGGARPKVTGALAFGDLAVERFLPVRQTALLAPPHRESDAPIILAQATPDAPAPKRAADLGRWSTMPMDLAPLAAIDADLTMTGTSLAYEGWRIEEPAFAISLAGATLDLTRLSGRFFDGALAARGTLEAAGSRRATIDMTLQQADLGAALKAITGSGVLTGRSDAEVQLATSGASPAALVAHLAGALGFSSKDGSISGIDLGQIGDRLTRSNRPTDIFELTRGVSSGTTRYEALEGSFHVADGVARSDTLRLLVADGEARASVTLDLPAWLIHGRAEFRLQHHPEVPPVAATLDGPLDMPRKVFDVNALEHYLTQRGTASSP